MRIITDLEMKIEKNQRYNRLYDHFNNDSPKKLFMKQFYP